MATVDERVAAAPDDDNDREEGVFDHDGEDQQDGVFDHSAKSVLFGEFAIELDPDIAAVAINDAGTDRMASAMVFSPDPEGEPLEPGIALGAMNADGTLGAFFIVRPVAE